MEIVKTADLFYKEGGSDKVYKIFIKKDEDKYYVEFSYGRRGNSLTSGTKTANAVTETEAEKIFGKMLSTQKGKGYRETGNTEVSVASDFDPRDTGVKPQLLNDMEEGDLAFYLNSDDWCMQEKFDGRRRLIMNSPNGNIATNRKGLSVAINQTIMDEFAEIMKFKSSLVILDGEDMGDNVMVFDLLNSVDSYGIRYIQLWDLVKESNVLNIVPTAWTSDEKHKFLLEMRETNAEGVVFKKKSSKYKPDRPNSGGDMIKYKFVATASCIVTSHHKAKRSIGVSVYDGDKLISVGNVTVYPNQEIPAVESIVEIKYLYYFPGGSLFQPVLLEQRDDIDKEDCIIEKLKAKRPTDED